MNYKVYGIFLITMGVIYLIKPDLFNFGIWKKVSISQQLFSARQHAIYIRVLGGIFIGIGSYFILS